MGTCFSKKKLSSSSSTCPPILPPSSSAAADSVNVAKSSATAMADPNGCKSSNSNNNPSKAGNTDMVKMKLKQEKGKEKQEQQEPEEEEQQQQPAVVKKEIFVIKHRKSHEGSRERDPKNQSFQQNGAQTGAKSDGSASSSSLIEAGSVELVENKAVPVAMGVGVRTSSCTKEEVDAILIQCGRLSRSSSGKAASSSASCERGRKYSGSKRSYDFDNDASIAGFEDKKNNDSNQDYDGDEEKLHSHSHRQRRASPSSHGRRRTPSRERDGQQRSSSRERRVSRSPGRRSSENTAGNSHSGGGGANRPGKMVSVPATVSSLAMDKSNNGDQSASAAAAANGTVKRISVRRNVGGEATTAMAGSRAAASPRAQSPSRGNTIAKASNEAHQQQQQPSLSRNSSRKAEHSPYRRNPLSEIDPNSLQYPQPHNNNNNNINRSQQNKFKRDTDQEDQEIHVVLNQKPNMEMNKTVSVVVPQGVSNYKANCRGTMDNNKVVNLLPAQQPPMSGPQTLTRTRSSRRSRDLDLDPENLLNQAPSYTRRLLEDIQNFQQKNTTTPITNAVSLPPCVSKACSILEAVADLNSTTSSNLSCAFSEDRATPPPGYNYSLNANLLRKNMSEKDPFMESEVTGNDDLTEPSFHKYVTVRRGGVDMEDQESSGSNSFVGGSGGGVHQQQWNLSSSSWEPNSADSTDCWTSKSNCREEYSGKSPLSLNMVEAEAEEEAWRRVSGRRSGGIGRGRLGGPSSIKGLHALPVAAAAASL